MKKLKKIAVKLNSEELKQLKGGEDFLNKNAYNGCTCEFYNAPSLTTNDNLVYGCTCTCKGY